MKNVLNGRRWTLLRTQRLLLCLVCSGAMLPAAAQPFDPSLFSGMRWRLVGPFRGGRTVTATGVPGEPEHFYFGAVGGGVWESENAGRTWKPIFDGQPIASIGAMAVAPSNPRILYVGTGEADMRSDIACGEGMYRSADGGKTWTAIGLTDSRQIGKILIDPKNPDLVFVAALGHAYASNPERGVFRSKDGGRTWKKVLGKDDDTGAIDLAFDPLDSRVLFASLWQTRRPPWNVYSPSNGPGSGLYRSADGGETWKQIRGNGFPSEKLGRIGIAFAPGDPKRVYAIVDAKEGGLYASKDGGSSWIRASSDVRIWGRGWYFGGVAVDPKDPSTVYVCNTSMYRSTDGGKTFIPIKGAPGGDDYHQLWIDPSDPKRMIVASDQGTVVSVDGAKTWSSWYNQPTAQFYHVATDDRFPYWIYGAQQDSGAAATPSRTDYGSILLRDWRPIAAGGENGYIAPDPTDANILWGGAAGRFDQTTLQDQSLDPALGYPGEYRSTWTLPLTFSPRDPKTLYYSNQFLFKTADGGAHWEKISPDLTREDPGVPTNLDPVTAKDTPPLVPGPRHGVIYAIAPSPLRDGDVWCGTDDGLIWRTRDDGKHWDNVTPRDLSPWSKVGILEASRFDAETAYAAIDRHRLDDLFPHILRTKDGGRTWTEITQGIPAGNFANVVREDPVRAKLLYAGTELGVFVSFDEGGHWQPLQLNLPACSVRDISIRRDDLVIATHGRSFWVLDDLTPLRELDGRVAQSEAWLFAPREAFRLHPAGFQGTPFPKDEPAGENPPSGAIVNYVLKTSATTPVSIEIVDGKGDLVRRYASDDKPRLPDLQRIVTTPDWAASAAPPDASPGMHRLSWDLRYAAPKGLPVSPFFGSAGLWAPPGQYAVRLTVAGRTLTQPLVLRKDPRIKAAVSDLIRQFELGRQIESERVRLAAALRQCDEIRKQLAALRSKSTGKSATEVETFSRKFEAIAGPPAPAAGEDFGEGPGAPDSLRRLSTSFQQFARALESADAAPTPDVLSGFRQRQSTLSQSLSRWQSLLQTDLPRVNESLASAGLTILKLE